MSWLDRESEKDKYLCSNCLGVLRKPPKTEAKRAANDPFSFVKKCSKCIAQGRCLNCGCSH